MFQDPLYHAVERLQSVNLIWHEKTEFKWLLSDWSNETMKYESDVLSNDVLSSLKCSLKYFLALVWLWRCDTGIFRVIGILPAFNLITVLCWFRKELSDYYVEQIAP